MINNFNEFLDKILKLEGGYVNHPNDSGGCTNNGITLSTFKRYFGNDKTCEHLKNITKEQISKIYKEGFWDPCFGDEIKNSSVAHIFVDWAINSGIRTAVKEIQKIVGETTDGVMGNKTLNAINSFNQQKLFKKIKESRIAFYENLIKKNPSLKVFLKGWLNRLNEYNWK